MESNDSCDKNTGSLSLLTETASEDDLISSVWQELPVELLSFVLTKLPGSALKEFCRVSKTWNALIQSEKFAHQCTSVESVVCYLCSIYLHHGPYIALPSPKTGSWQTRILCFPRDERDVVEDYYLIAADHGLLCFRVFNRNDYEDEIYFVVLNPLSGYWRRLIVPYSFETGLANRSCNSILWGLIMDQESGSYKVVVAFIDTALPRKTYIFDSSSNSWMISAAISPAVDREDSADDDMIERGFDRSITSGYDLFWLVGVNTDNGYLRMLIKYSLKLDAWSTVSTLWPYLETYEAATEEGESKTPFHLASLRIDLSL